MRVHVPALQRRAHRAARLERHFALGGGAALSRTLAERALAGGRSISANRFRSESDDYEESVRILRELLNGRLPGDGEGD